MMQPVVLKPEEVVQDRPFVHPAQIDTDVTNLRFMVDQLCLFLENPKWYAHLPRPVMVHRPGRRNWIYRLIVPRPQQLLQPGELTFVGFLGDRRPDADLGMADEFDRTLIAEIPTYPGLLSYCSLALVSGNFSNLVVFANPEAKAHWSKSLAHAQAAQKLAPHYYRSIKLYNGVLPAGVADSGALRLTCVKYYAYGPAAPWRAIRQLEAVEA